MAKKIDINNKNIFLTKDDKVDLIKWMVGLWLSGIGLLIGVLKFL